MQKMLRSSARKHPKEIKNKIFRMQMSVRKENYEKSLSGLEGIQTELNKVLQED